MYNSSMDYIYDKLIDVEKDMEFMKTNFLASFADRMAKNESAIDCLEKKINIFVPDREETKGVEAYFGKVNTQLDKHYRDINLLKKEVFNG